MASWHGVYRLFVPIVPKLAFRVFWSEPKRCATNSYADSWWYHLEKCLLRPFRAHLRFWLLCHFEPSSSFTFAVRPKQCTRIVSVNRTAPCFMDSAASGCKMAKLQEACLLVWGTCKEQGSKNGSKPQRHFNHCSIRSSASNNRIFGYSGNPTIMDFRKSRFPRFPRNPEHPDFLEIDVVTAPWT